MVNNYRRSYRKTPCGLLLLFIPESPKRSPPCKQLLQSCIWKVPIQQPPLCALHGATQICAVCMCDVRLMLVCLCRSFSNLIGDNHCVKATAGDSLSREYSLQRLGKARTWTRTRYGLTCDTKGRQTQKLSFTAHCYIGASNMNTVEPHRLGIQKEILDFNKIH